MHGPSVSKGGVVEAQVQEGDSNKKRKVDSCHPLEVAFGLPWTWETFVNKAVHSQHPFVQGTGVALELQEAINKHVEWNDEQLCKYRLDWCKKWLIRAKQLDQLEKESNSSQPPHVAEVTKGKRVLLTREILEELAMTMWACCLFWKWGPRWLVRLNRRRFLRLSLNFA